MYICALGSMRINQSKFISWCFFGSYVSKKTKNDNTIKTEKWIDKAFMTFLTTMGVDEKNLDYWNYTKPELDTYLDKFWFGARKNVDMDTPDLEQDDNMTGMLYKANSLCNFQYRQNWILKQKGHLYDIKKTASCYIPTSL